MKIARLLVIAALLATVACKESDKKSNNEADEAQKKETLLNNLSTITGSSPSTIKGNAGNGSNGSNGQCNVSSQQQMQSQPQATPPMYYGGPNAALVNCTVQVINIPAPGCSNPVVYLSIANTCRQVLGYDVPVTFECISDGTCRATPGSVTPYGSPSAYVPGNFSPAMQNYFTEYTLRIGPGVMSIRVQRKDLQTHAPAASMEFPFRMAPGT